MADTATFSGAMKTKFLGPIRDLMKKDKVLLWGDPEANPEEFKGILPSAEGIDFVGNEFRIPIKVKRNAAVGFRHENEALPSPGASKYTYIQEPLRFHYSSFNITGQLLKAAESNEGAFRSAFKAEMEETITSGKLDYNRAAHGDGSGKLASVSRDAASSDTDVYLDTTVNFFGSEIIDFTDTSGTVVSAAHEVVSYDRTNLKITVSPALAARVTAGTHFPVRASLSSTTSTPNNSLNREIQGLQSLVSGSGVLHGISPTNYPQWKSHVRTGVGAIRDAVLRDAKDNIGFETGVEADSLNFAILTTRGVRNRYADTLTAVKRFSNTESVKLRGGFTALMFDENPIFTDDQCLPGNVWGLALDKFFWSQASDWEWMEKDGSVLQREDGYDRYKAVLFKYGNLGTTHRGMHFRLTGVTDDAR